jgi:hypothetical protein
MKRFIILLLLVLVVPSVGALQLDFQNAGDFADQIDCVRGTYNDGDTSGATSPIPSWCTYVHDTSAGNSYLNVYSSATQSGYGSPYYSGFMINSVPLISSYAAATNVGGTGDYGVHSIAISLMDSSKVNMYYYRFAYVGPARWEVKVTGGTAYIYKNGVLQVTSSALAQNPSYIGFGTHTSAAQGANANNYWDDYVYGTSENKYIYDMPETGAYIIKKDMLNPAASGLYTSGGVIVDANYMSTRFGRGNSAVPPDALTNESINLVQWGGVIPYATLYTSTDYAGARIYNIHEALINSTAPYGYYAITIPGSALYSDPILYESGGATVTWDKDIYSVGDTGVIVSYVASGGYWDPAVYDYQLVVQDIFGNVIKSQTVNTQSGSMSVTFTSNDNLGVYYAILKAKLKSSATYDIWMSVDAAELQAYIVFNGYVMNAESGAVLADATVNVTQGIATKNSISGSYGWNSTNNWLSGSQFNITTNKSGYTSDVRLFTPLTSKSIALNISLVPSPATTVGTSVGGVVRDNVYGNPVVGATYWVQNGTTHSSTTNIAGFARVDNLPVPNTWYNVWSSKTGFGNSSVVRVMAVAA